MKYLVSLSFIWLLLLSTASQANPVTIKGYPKILTDKTGLVYVGISVEESKITHFLGQLKRHLGTDKYEVYRKNQKQRDHGEFHITLINPFELKEIDQDKLNLKQEFDFLLIGLGKAEKSGDQSYFIVAESQLAQSKRKLLGLNNKDFHVTVGFNSQDVFGVSKGKDALLAN